MAPGILSDPSAETVTKANGNGYHVQTTPLRTTGALDAFDFEETTPVIGREYPKVNIAQDLLGARNADELIRDLAITSENSHLK
jgi:hypothetical protein